MDCEKQLWMFAAVKPNGFENSPLACELKKKCPYDVKSYFGDLQRS